MDDEELSILLTLRCTRYVRRVDASFVSKRDFSYGWKVSRGVVAITVSDYLRDSPPDVVVDFGEMVVRRSVGLRSAYPESFLRYVDTPEYIGSGRPLFIKRSRNLAGTDVGSHACLMDSLQRLLDSGLLTPADVEDSWFSWTIRSNRTRMGFCSTMFRVVGISAILDSPDASQDALDYVVYHECLHLRQRYRPGSRVHDEEFRSWERRFPGWDRCDKELERLARGRRANH